MEKLDSILSKNTVRHSYFSLKYFVLGKENTIQGKLWQCLIELQSRKENLDSLILQIEDTKDNIELKKIRLKNLEGNSEETTIHKRKLERKILTLEKILSNLENSVTYIKEEIEFLISIFEELNEVEEIKPFDDEESQRKYWSAKLEEELNLRSLLSAPLDLELVKTILSLPDGTSVKTNLIKGLSAARRQALNEKKVS